MNWRWHVIRSSGKERLPNVFLHRCAVLPNLAGTKGGAAFIFGGTNQRTYFNQVWKIELGPMQGPGPPTMEVTLLSAAQPAAAAAQGRAVAVAPAVVAPRPTLAGAPHQNRPRPRSASSLVAIGESSMLLFGGSGTWNDFFYDTWRLDIVPCCDLATPARKESADGSGSNKDSRAGSSSSARDGCAGGAASSSPREAAAKSTAAAAAAGHGVLFTEVGHLSRVSPPARWGHAAVGFQGKVYLFGGTCPGQAFSDLWRFDPSTGQWVEVRLCGGEGAGVQRAAHDGAVDGEEEGGEGTRGGGGAGGGGGGDMNESDGSSEEEEGAGDGDDDGSDREVWGEDVHDEDSEGRDSEAQDDEAVLNLRDHDIQPLAPPLAEQQCFPHPAGRGGHAACVDPRTGYMYVHGGNTVSASFDDCWRLDLGAVERHVQRVLHPECNTAHSTAPNKPNSSIASSAGGSSSSSSPHTAAAADVEFQAALTAIAASATSVVNVPSPVSPCIGGLEADAGAAEINAAAAAAAAEGGTGGTADGGGGRKERREGGWGVSGEGLGVAWEQLPRRGSVPPPRIGHTLLAVGSRLVVFGGRDYLRSAFQQGVHVLDLASLTWVDATPTEKTLGPGGPLSSGSGTGLAPQRRTGHVGIVHDQGVVFVGGLGEEPGPSSFLADPAVFLDMSSARERGGGGEALSFS